MTDGAGIEPVPGQKELAGPVRVSSPRAPVDRDLAITDEENA